jgi:hypothetical protein
MHSGQRRRSPVVLRKIEELGEVLGEIVKEIVEVVETLEIYRRFPTACLINFRYKTCPAVKACLLARLRYIWL